MDVFNFCWVTLLDEAKKCSVFFDKNTCNVRNDIEENFSKPVNRVSYLYKFGSYNIFFFHRCVWEFFSKAPDSSKIIDNFRSLNNLNICSMSAGPGTDIIGFLYSLFLINKPLVNPVALRAISRYGSWRNLVTEMMSSSIISIPGTSTCKLIESDFLKELNKKAQGYLKAADILLMCNSFSSSVTYAKVIKLQKVIQLLKPGALVFFIDSKEKSTYFKEIGSFGTFLYGPVEVTLENMPYNEKVAELVGVEPLCSDRSLFAVWQKKHEVSSQINLQKEKEYSVNAVINKQSSAKLINSGARDIESQTPSMSGLKREFSSDTNVSSSDTTSYSSQFSSSSVSSQIIKKREKEPVSDSSVSFNGHKIGFSETNFNFASNVSPASVNATDSLLRNKYAPLCESGPKKKENNGNNMDSLLKNFESLVTKFEGLIISRDSSKHSNVQKKQSSSSQQCHQKLHEGHCRCSINPCEFKGNNSTCCHSMCYNTNHCCSTNAASSLYRFLPQEGPCLVIQLQNLSNESIAQILSIVSRDCASVNKT